MKVWPFGRNKNWETALKGPFDNIRSAIYTAREMEFMYYFSGNSAASAPISTVMCLRAIYIVPGSVYIFPPAE